MGIMDTLGVTDPLTHLPRKPQTYNNKYVVVYDFTEVGTSLEVVGDRLPFDRS